MPRPDHFDSYSEIPEIVPGVFVSPGDAVYIVDDDEALRAFHTLTRVEGIMPALESSHALAYAEKLAARMTPEQVIVVNLSGRGDKDIHTVAQIDGIQF